MDDATTKGAIIVGLFLFLFVFVPIVYSFFLSRIRNEMLKKIKRLMHKNTDQKNIEFIDDQELQELPAKTKLQFLKLNADSHLIEASQTRKNTISKIRSRYQLRLLIDLIFLMLYFFIAYKFVGVFRSIGLLIENGRNEQNFEIIRQAAIQGDVFINYILSLNFIAVIVILVVWLILKYFGSYYRFSAYKNKVLNAIKPLWNFISYLFVSKLGLPLYFILITLGIVLWTRTVINLGALTKLYDGNLKIYAFLFLLAAIAHFFIHYKTMIRSRRQANLKLLILRVFGQHALSQNLFTKMGRYWKMFGTFFTVIDRSYYQVFWKKKYNSNIGIYIFISFIFFVAFMLLGSSLEVIFGDVINALLLGLALLGFVAPLFFISSYNAKKIKREVISSEEKLKDRLKTLEDWPTRFDNSYKEVPVLCYNDTWRMAVDRLSKVADVILMDLRGYSETNKGCEYEVNFLFDHVPIDKILFITDSESVMIIEQLLFEQWKDLLETSPNLKIEKPEAVLYVTADRKETNKETQGILETSLFYAIKSEDLKKIAS